MLKYFALIACIAVAIPAAYAAVQTFENIVTDNIFVNNAIYVDTLCQKDGTCYKLKDLAIHKAPSQGFGCPFGFETYIGGTQGICQSKSPATSQIPVFLPQVDDSVPELLNYLRDSELERYATLKGEILDYEIQMESVCPEDLTGHLGSTCQNIIKHYIPSRQVQIDTLLDTARERQAIGWIPDN